MKRGEQRLDNKKGSFVRRYRPFVNRNSPYRYPLFAQSPPTLAPGTFDANLIDAPAEACAYRDFFQW